MRKTLLAIRHVYFEDLGILEPELIKYGFNINYTEAPLNQFQDLDPKNYDLIVILGAPIGAFDETQYPFLKNELNFIQRCLNLNKPILGICLGAQLIARILGATVYPMGYKEIGFSPLILNKNIENNPLRYLGDIPVLHWHGDQFDIPQSCTPLASSAMCKNQAFIYDDHILALQFHMEADPSRIEQWLVGHSHELNSAKIDLHQLRSDARIYNQTLTQAGKNTFQHWLAKITQ
ncbi:glutamine amidotransferase [Commensalibacter oyaizuii]|uniref:Glutamine amidotransferase n=1 Tax=Commensalibacter oyaizuii TaxID=3043873 RepID=A0ABT6PYL9_9PROT|nr:glutamine amidotransferase [Commensalibacter sp. TBRC 16381]MDI2089948.1 glutamine amidotransferase [Commensalibacter sp. TBRC 16381]